MDLPEGFASYSLLNGADICGEATESFQVVWQTEIEVELERTKKNCVELLPLYLRPMII